MSCEVCGAPATHTCGGLDVPMLYFCDEHAEAHKFHCPQLRAGISRIEKHEQRANPDDAVREALIADTEPQFSAERSTREQEEK